MFYNCQGLRQNTRYVSTQSSSTDCLDMDRAKCSIKLPCPIYWWYAIMPDTASYDIYTHKCAYMHTQINELITTVLYPLNVLYYVMSS